MAPAMARWPQTPNATNGDEPVDWATRAVSEERAGQALTPVSSTANQAVRRLAWLTVFLLLWGACIVAKLISLQLVHHQEYLRIARRQQEIKITILAPRGTVFDRGEQPLAMSVPM